MPISDQDRLLIEKYLDKKLTETELLTFDKRLEDPDFADEVKLYTKAVQAILAFGDEKMKAMLKAEDEKFPIVIQPLKGNSSGNSQHKKITTMWRRWLIAACFLLVSVSLVWFGTNRNTDNAGKVFATYFKPYPNYEKPNSRNGTTKNNLEKAYAAYDNGDYQLALTYFETSSPSQYDAQFFQANAYLAIDQAEKAIPILEKLSRDSAFKWQQQAEWYLVLALSERSDKTEVKRLIEKICQNTNHPYYSESKKISKNNQ